MQINRLSHKRKKRLKHKFKAKGRHSIHSPFLFDLYEDCVKKNHNLSKRKKILLKIKSLNNSKHISKSKIEIRKKNFLNCLSKKTNGELATINANNSKEYIIAIFNGIVYSKKNNFIVIDNIHLHKDATDAWEEIIKKDNVSLSVDFYHLGLISISKDFTKQHFRLKM